MDKISDLISEALSDARAIGASLDQKLIGLLEPRHRPAAIDISLRIADRRIISELFLRDLQAFYVLLDRLAQEETMTGWRGHDPAPDCVYPIPIGIDRARIYLGFVDQLVDLGSSIAAALDAAEAHLSSTRLLEA